MASTVETKLEPLAGTSKLTSASRARPRSSIEDSPAKGRRRLLDKHSFAVAGKNILNFDWGRQIDASEASVNGAPKETKERSPNASRKRGTSKVL